MPTPGMEQPHGAADRGSDARALRLRTRSRYALALIAVTVIALGNPAAAAAGHKHAPAKHAVAKHGTAKHAAAKHAAAKHAAAAKKSGRKSHDGKSQSGKRQSGKHGTAAKHRDHKHGQTSADADATPALPPDLAATKQAIEYIRQGRFSEAAGTARTIGDPVAQKLVEWAVLRHADSDAGLGRYAAFLHANPEWPNGLLHRRMEAKLWHEQRDLAALRSLDDEPLSAAGRLALAQVEMRHGDRASAERRVRAVWRSAELSAEMESAVLTAFPGVLTRADHVARMDRRIGSRDFGAAARAAKHAGDDYPAVVKACSGADAKPAKGAALLADVPSAMRSDLGYVLCRVHWLLRNEVPGANLSGETVTPKADIATAVKLLLAASPEDLARQDTDEWWRTRRTLARKLLDLGDAQTAYSVVSAAALPANRYYQADYHFTCGWIALRFLNDPDTALAHFARVDEGSTDPIVLARGAYWRGRAEEAAGRADAMRAQYERAASFPTAYYGQLARARIGLSDIAVVRPPPQDAPQTAAELVGAADILYTIGEKGLVRSFVASLAEESSNAATLSAVGEVTVQHDDAPAMLILGKTALARGLALDRYAFPATGVPYSAAIGHRLDRCIVYSIVRTESAFDQNDRSAAKAVGLMQVTPQAGRDTAKRFGMAYDWDRLVNDPVYNTEMGAAEVAALLSEYHGSYVLTFAGYNAGRGRVRQWVALHGDPRDPRVDAVDWVERIPFAETRNYVQRVMENLQVYRARFGATTATVEPNLHRAATLE